MTPYEIVLSKARKNVDSLESGKEDLAKKIFDKWNLDFAVIGKTINSKYELLLYEKLLIYLLIP